jgi:hypothetical protein
LVTDVTAVPAFTGLRSEKPHYVLSLKERHIELVEAHGSSLSIEMERHHARSCIVDIGMAATEEDAAEKVELGWEELPPGDINPIICGDAYAPNSKVSLWVKRMTVEKSAEQLFFEGGIREEKWYNERLQRMVDYLALDELEVQQLHRLYVEVDTDKGGTIDRDEFFEWIEEPRSVRRCAAPRRAGAPPSRLWPAVASVSTPSSRPRRPCPSFLSLPHTRTPLRPRHTFLSHRRWAMRCSISSTRAGAARMPT